MRAPTALTAAALATTAALLLSGCGGNATSSGPIKGAQTGIPTPSLTATSNVQRPSITFPAGAKNVFQGMQTGDPKKDAVLTDNAAGINSVDQAILLGNLKLPALAFYNSGPALATSITYIHGYLDKGDTWVGVTRYFNQRVTFLNDGSADVIYCSDESQSNLKNRKTGKVDNQPTTADSYVLYNARLVQDKDGVWQTTNVASNRGDKECQP